MIDIAPTILEVAGLPEPIFVNGVSSIRSKASSMAYSFNDARAAERHETQYFEMAGNRGIYHKGWTARDSPSHAVDNRSRQAAGRSTMMSGSSTTPRSDWSQAKDIVERESRKARTNCNGLWLIEAVKYNVLPLDDRFAERANPDIAGRPQLTKGNRQLLFGGMGRLSESSHHQHQEQVARRDGGGRRAASPGRRGVIVAARRTHRRLEPLRQGRQAEVLL